MASRIHREVYVRFWREYGTVEVDDRLCLPHDLDIQVQKLKMLKSNFLSEKYGLEDKVIKFYPQQIAYLKSRVEGLTKDVETAKLHPKPIDEQPLGMTVSGVSYSEKAEAGQAIINTCKSMNSPDAIPLGEYRGFQMEGNGNAQSRGD